MRAIQTVRQTSRMSMQGMEAQLTMVGKRPNLMRQEITIQGQTVVMANDGTTPWMINPLLGSTSAIALTGPQADLTREQSAFDGPLVDYKTRGSTLELVGTEPLGAGKVHHLKLSTKAGIVQHIYIDTETMLDTLLVIEGAGTGSSSRNCWTTGTSRASRCRLRSASSRTASCRPRSKSTRSSSIPRSTTPCSRCRSDKIFQHEGHEGHEAHEGF